MFLCLVSELFLFPILNQTSSPSLPQNNRLVAEDVMHADFSYLFPITRVRSVVTVLRVSSSSAFPVVRLDHRTSVTQDTVGQHTPFLYSLPRASLWRQNEQLSSVINSRCVCVGGWERSVRGVDRCLVCSFWEVGGLGVSVGAICCSVYGIIFNTRRRA